MSAEESVEVVVHIEAGLEGTVVVQLGLELVDVLATESLEGTSTVGLGPGGARVALASVAKRRGSVTRVVGSTTREALVGAGGVTVVDQIVPGNGGVSTIATTGRAIQDGLRGDGGAGGGLTIDAKTVSVGLNRAEIPARTTLLLIQDLPFAFAPVLTGIEVGGEGESSRHKAGKKEDDLHNYSPSKN